MITRGFVEQIVTPYIVKVRMPSINNMGMTGQNMLSKDLNDATICTMSHVDPALKVGDVVFVAFEDNNKGKPVVIGHLYREHMGDSFINMQIDSLVVNMNASLPTTTTIGDVTYQNLKSLIGQSEPLSKQIETINQRILNCEDTLTVIYVKCAQGSTKPIISASQKTQGKIYITITDDFVKHEYMTVKSEPDIYTWQELL